MSDVCPHRLAPLSQGRVDPQSGCIECPYHGWQFAVDGTCTRIPQLDASKGGKIPLRASKESFPVEVIGDLIWAYLPLPPGQASYFPDKPDKIMPEMKTRGLWTSRELPYSFDFLLENFMDPAHLPFAHHKLQGVRNDSGEVREQVLTDLDDGDKIEVAFQDQIRGRPRDSIVSFTPPCYFHYRQKDSKTGEFVKKLIALVVPVSPGRCRIFTSVPPIPLKLPRALLHFISGKFLDSDIWLHDCEVNFRKRHTNSFGHGMEEARPDKYFMPTESDSSVKAFRQWWAKHLSLSPVFGPNLDPKYVPIESQLDRYQSHSKHCGFCQDALRQATFIKNASPVLALLLIAVSNSIPLRIAAVLGYAVVNNISDKVIKGVLGPHRGDAYSAAKMSPKDD